VGYFLVRSPRLEIPWIPGTRTDQSESLIFHSFVHSTNHSSRSIILLYFWPISIVVAPVHYGLLSLPFRSAWFWTTRCRQSGFQIVFLLWLLSRFFYAYKTPSSNLYNWAIHYRWGAFVLADVCDRKCRLNVKFLSHFRPRKFTSLQWLLSGFSRSLFAWFSRLKLRNEGQGRAVDLQWIFVGRHVCGAYFSWLKFSVLVECLVVVYVYKTCFMSWILLSCPSFSRCLSALCPQLYPLPYKWWQSLAQFESLVCFKLGQMYWHPSIFTLTLVQKICENQNMLQNVAIF